VRRLPAFVVILGVLLASGDMIHWIADRFAGGKDPDPYQPTGQPDVQTTTCGA
jgi:hypothetical protein